MNELFVIVGLKQDHVHTLRYVRFDEVFMIVSFLGNRLG